jgi:hypothetical protein
MERNDFQTAVSRAKANHGAEWHLMSQAARADAIYSELRELDRKIVLQTIIRRPPWMMANQWRAYPDIGPPEVITGTSVSSRLSVPNLIRPQGASAERTSLFCCRPLWL